MEQIAMYHCPYCGKLNSVYRGPDGPEIMCRCSRKTCRITRIQEANYDKIEWVDKVEAIISTNVREYDLRRPAS